MAQTVVAADANSTTPIEMAWNPGGPGPQRLFVRMDEARQVNEYDEGNNDAWRDVYIGLASPLMIDSGGGDAYDPAYTPQLGFGYLGSPVLGACDAKRRARCEATTAASSATASTTCCRATSTTWTSPCSNATA